MSERIALVTGGSRGLGKNAVLKLAAEGTGIILTWNSSQQEAQDVVQEIERKGGKAAALQLNVGDTASFTRFAQQVKETLKQVWQRDTFDYLVNNAGTGLYAPYTETTEAQFDDAVNIHFKGPFFPHATAAAANKRRRADPERLKWTGPFYSARFRHLRGNERGDGSADPLSGKRAWRAWDFRQYHRAWRH